MTRIVFLALFLPLSARAYVIQSSFTEACHERITLEALLRADPIELSPPADTNATWYRHGDRMGRVLLEDPSGTPSENLLVASAVLGVRRPDLGENGLIHVHDIRYVHLLDENQMRHFLRTGAQDGQEGAVFAGEDARAFIMALIDASADAYDDDPDGQRREPVVAWIEDYGRIEIEVWLPMYLLAQALHALQDSFTHTYRTADTQRILAIQNYVDADNAHDEERDGPRHSDALDDCLRDDTTELVESAGTASTELILATQRYWIDRDRTHIETVLNDWTQLDEGCTPDNDYCDSPWVPIAKSGETYPLLGCSASPRSRAPWWALALALVAARLPLPRFAGGGRGVGDSRR